MITGSIKFNTEPEKHVYNHTPNYHPYDWDSDGDYMGYGGYNKIMPKFADQPKILEESLDAGKGIGLKLGARVKRKHGALDQLGTITHIHDTFSMAWNYTTGILEPYKVAWDPFGNVSQPPNTYDYSARDLIVVNNETIEGEFSL